MQVNQEDDPKTGVQLQALRLIEASNAALACHVSQDSRLQPSTSAATCTKFLLILFVSTARLAAWLLEGFRPWGLAALLGPEQLLLAYEQQPAQWG